MPEWWTVAELATHYNLDPSTVRNAIVRGDLRAHKLGGYRVHDADRISWEAASVVRVASRKRRAKRPEASAADRELIRRHLG